MTPTARERFDWTMAQLESVQQLTQVDHEQTKMRLEDTRMALRQLESEVTRALDDLSETIENTLGS